MKTIFRRLLMPAHFVIAGALILGCSNNPTTAVVENRYPVAHDGGSSTGTTVFKAWWVTTLFPTPVRPGATSETERTIPGSDYAYVLIAPGWVPDSDLLPARLIALKSISKLSATEHSLLTIAVSDEGFAGNCAAGSTLDADDARLIVERIFPGEFAGVTYDPATCASTPATADGSAPDGQASGDAGASHDAAND